jgi:hypothetical protein
LRSRRSEACGGQAGVAASWPALGQACPRSMVETAAVSRLPRRLAAKG